MFTAHRYDESIHEFRSAKAVQPNDANLLWTLAFPLIANHQAKDAIAPLEKAVSLSHRSSGIIAVLIGAYAQAGRRRDALRLLAELKKRQQGSYVPAGALVNAYLDLGDHEHAFMWLERAYKEQSNILQFVKVHPFFDPLRDLLIWYIGLG